MTEGYPNGVSPPAKKAMEEHTVFEDEDDLPDGIEDITPRSYVGPLLHGKCPVDECGLEGGITVFREGEKTFCEGTEEFNEGREKRGHLVKWEVIDHD